MITFLLKAMLKKDIIVTSLENIEVLILYRSYRRAKNMEIKVMSDVFYGKTMENLRSRVDVRLIRTKNII